MNNQIDLRKRFEDLILVKQEQNRILNFIESMDKLDKDYDQKKLEYEEELKRANNIRKNIESCFLRSDGSLYAGSGYLVKELVGKPTIEPVIIDKSAKRGHFSIQGTTSVGKSTLMLLFVRQNLAAKENVIVIDPKGGENQEVLSTIIESAYDNDMLQHFLYYSLSYPELSDQLNPLFGMSHEERASLLSVIASMGNSEQFFSDIVYQVTYAISLAFEVVELSDDPMGVKAAKISTEELKKYNSWKRSSGYSREKIHESKEIFIPDAIDLSFLIPRSPEFKSLTYASLMTFKDISEYSSYEKLKYLRLLVASTSFDFDLRESNQEKYEDYLSAKKLAIAELDRVLSNPQEFFTKISASLSTLLTQLSTGPMGKIFCTLRINPLAMRLFDKTSPLEKNRSTQEKKSSLSLIIDEFSLNYTISEDEIKKAIINSLKNMFDWGEEYDIENNELKIDGIQKNLTKNNISYIKNELIRYCQLNDIKKNREQKIKDTKEEESRVVCLIHPFPLRFRKISDMSSKIFMLMLENIFGRIGSTGRGFNERLNIHVDEARSVAYPSLERVPAQVGGVGGSMYFYTQSFADWEGALGSESAARTMLDNLNTQIYFRMKETSSADKVVDSLDSERIITSSSAIENNGDARLMLSSEDRHFAKASDITRMKIGRFTMITGEKNYLVDAAFANQLKGSIKMPKIDIETKIDELNKFDREWNKISRMEKIYYGNNKKY